MPRETFRAIFETRIEDLIEQFANNHLLFMVNEALLSNKDTCLVYGTILLEHLLSKMKEMGEEDQEKSNLYLKLFKSIFDTVSNRSTESESLLRPHLSNIVNRYFFCLFLFENITVLFIIFKIIIVHFRIAVYSIKI